MRLAQGHVGEDLTRPPLTGALQIAGVRGRVAGLPMGQRAVQIGVLELGVQLDRLVVVLDRRRVIPQLALHDPRIELEVRVGGIGG